MRTNWKSTFPWPTTSPPHNRPKSPWSTNKPLNGWTKLRWSRKIRTSFLGGDRVAWNSTSKPKSREIRGRLLRSRRLAFHPTRGEVPLDDDDDSEWKLADDDAVVATSTETTRGTTSHFAVEISTRSGSHLTRWTRTVDPEQPPKRRRSHPAATRRWCGTDRRPAARRRCCAVALAGGSCDSIRST